MLGRYTRAQTFLLLWKHYANILDDTIIYDAFEYFICYREKQASTKRRITIDADVPGKGNLNCTTLLRIEQN